MTTLADAIMVINKLENFELDNTSPPRLGLRVSSRSEALVDTPRLAFTFRSGIEPLIKTEFNNLADLAGRFTKKEVRGLGRLEVAKLYLQSSK